MRAHDLVSRMHHQLRGCLAHLIAPRGNSAEFLAQLLAQLPDLRTLSTLHTEKLVVFRTEFGGLNPAGLNSKANGHLANNMSTFGAQIEQTCQLDATAANTKTVNYGGNFENGANFEAIDKATPNGCPKMAESKKGGGLILAATLAGLNSHSGGGCPMRQNLAQNGLTITPVIRGLGAASSQSPQQPTPTATAIQNGGLNYQSCPATAADKTGGLILAGLNFQSAAQPTQQQNGGEKLESLLKTSGLNLAPNSGGLNWRRKLDSPTDSGIESGNENLQNGGVNLASGNLAAAAPISSGSSSCSSPRSSLDDQDQHFSSVSSVSSGE